MINQLKFSILHSRIKSKLPLFAVLPTAVGSSFCFLLPQHILKVEGQGMFNFYIDFLLRRAKSNWIIFLRESKVSATLIFSILNAFIVAGMMKKSTVSFWFASPAIGKENNENEITAENSCSLVHGDVKCAVFLRRVSYLNLNLS